MFIPPSLPEQVIRSTIRPLGNTPPSKEAPQTYKEGRKQTYKWLRGCREWVRFLLTISRSFFSSPSFSVHPPFLPSFVFLYLMFFPITHNFLFHSLSLPCFNITFGISSTTQLHNSSRWRHVYSCHPLACSTHSFAFGSCHPHYVAELDLNNTLQAC